MSTVIGSDALNVVGNAMKSCASFSEATYSMSPSWNSRSSAWRIRWSHGVSRSRSNPWVSRLPFVWRVVLGVEARERVEIVDALISRQRILRVGSSDADREEQQGYGEATHGGPPSCEAGILEWRCGRHATTTRPLRQDVRAEKIACAFSAHGAPCRNGGTLGALDCDERSASRRASRNRGLGHVHPFSISGRFGCRC